LTNNILGAAPIVENSLETDETDEVPDLPHLPPTFLAHHAKGIGAPPPVSQLSAKIDWRHLHICHSTTSSSTRSRSAGNFKK